MSTWYHRTSWKALGATWIPALRRRFSAAAAFHGQLPSPPFLLMADHANEFDPYIIGSYFGHPIRYMANIEGVAPWKAAFAEAVGAFARRKGRVDLGALRRTIDLVARGDAVGLFPEGDRSWDGRSEPARPGAARLVKRLGVPLVLVRQRGNYLALPRWALSPRRGPWSLEFRVFEVDEIDRLSLPLLDAIIAATLRRDEVREAAAEGRDFDAGGGAAEGVGRLLWRCPVCGKADGIEGRGDRILCRRCGADWRMDGNLRIRPANHSGALHAAPIRDIVDWHEWQVATLPELYGGDPDLGTALASRGVRLARRDGARLRRLGPGSLSYRSGEVVFEGERGRAVFDPAAVSGFVDNFNAFSEFSHRGERWRVDFGGGNAAKWIFALRRLQARSGAAEALAGGEGQTRAGASGGRHGEAA